MNEPQITSCFPNDNKKRIDYVIVYKITNNDTNSQNNTEHEDNRSKFLKLIENETIIRHSLSYSQNDEKFQFELLHCPCERLMNEAEKLKLEMRLNNTFLDEKETEYLETKWSLAVNEIIRKITRKKKTRKDDKGDIVSAPFERSIKHLFADCDDLSLRSGNGPFSPNHRSLLVHNILVNLNLNTDKDSKNKKEIKKKVEGLDYMLDKKYFDDAFILHDDSRHFIHLVQLLSSARKSINPDQNDQWPIFKKKVSHDGDVRLDLHKKWAKITKIFQTQPLDSIRYYFGESIALYFAWIGKLIQTLILPALIGFIFFIVGIISSSQKIDRTTVNNMNSTGANSDSIYGDYYLNLFADSFDNDLTPFFALIICLWGAIFSESWKRRNNEWAYEWDVLKYEHEESDLPEFVSKREKEIDELENATEFKKYLYSWKKFFKLFFSYSVLIFMVCVVCLEIALVVLFRIHIKKKVFPNDETLGVIIGDIGSSIFNTILTMVMDFIYTIIAKKFTKWENYRTKTEFDDALIIKLFIFEFVNSYGSLFYIAFFRTIEYDNGLFGLGKEYQDKCDNDNCMALLSIQVLVVLIIKPFPPFLRNFIWPWIYYFIKRIMISFRTKEVGVVNDEENISIEKINENKVSLYIATEKNKINFDETISQEYNQKIILYGYVMLFACSFSLGPFLLLLINVVDLRVDAYRVLWLYRRPIGFRAQDIGAWFSIIRFLNVVGIISNAFIIAFTSNWSKTFLKGTMENRLIFVVAFEHVVFFLWLLIIILFPDVPRSVSAKIRAETQMVKRIISEAKSKNQKLGENEKPILKNSEDEFPKSLDIPLRDDAFVDTVENRIKIDSRQEVASSQISQSDLDFDHRDGLVFVEESKELPKNRSKRNKKYGRLLSQITPIK